MGKIGMDGVYMTKNTRRVIALIIFICLVLSGCGSGVAPAVNNKELPQETSANNDLPIESGTNNSEDKVIINDITNWEHPVKSVLEKNNIQIIKLELTDNKTYPTFYVVLPSEVKDKESIDKVIKLIAEANGYWDYTLIDDSKNLKIQVSNDKNNKIVKSYVYNGVKTDIVGDSYAQLDYEKYSKFLNVNDNVAKFIKEDIDLDGKQEIVIAYGYGSGPLQTYILRETGNTLQKIGQIVSPGYGVYGINLVKMRGSKHKYIEASISNGANLVGFALYEVNANKIDEIVYSASASGSGGDGLTSTTKDDVFDGYVQSRHSYDVMYFGIERFYKWDGTTFIYDSTSVDTGDYPIKPAEVVEQFLALNMLSEEDRKSSDVLKRLNEINVSNKQLNVDMINKVIQSDTQESWLTDLLCYNLELVTQENATSASVTVPINNNKLTFTLIKNNNKWQISDIKGDFVINKN